MAAASVVMVLLLLSVVWGFRTDKQTRELLDSPSVIDIFNKAKSEKGPALTGEIDGKRVAVFQNKKWSEDDDTSKQPRYHVLESTYKAKVQKA